MDFSELIQANRPHLSASSVKTYNSILRNLAKRIGDEANAQYFEQNVTKVMDALKDMDAKRRKTILSALVVLCERDGSKACKLYRDAMMEDADVSREEAKKQLMTDKDKARWMSLEDVYKKVEQHAAEVKPLMNKDELTMSDIQRIQNYIIAAVMFGMHIPPRRLMDWTDMVRVVDKANKLNYIQGKNFVFNSFKTARIYGQQRVEMPVKLHNIVKRWLALTKGISEWFFFDNNANQLSVSQLGARIEKILGDGRGINIIRHIYITDKVLANAPLLQELEQTAADMGHSLQEQQLYRKVDKSGKAVKSGVK